MFSRCFNRFTKFGGPVPYRPAEDMAFSVARFIQKGGSFINYYMVKLKLWPFFLPCLHAISSLSNSHTRFVLLSIMVEQILVGLLVVRLSQPAMIMTLLLTNMVSLLKISFSFS